MSEIEMISNVDALNSITTATNAGVAMNGVSDSSYDRMAVLVLFANANASPDTVTINDGTHDILTAVVPANDTVVLMGTVDNPILNFEAGKTYTATTGANDIIITVRIVRSPSIFVR